MKFSLELKKIISSHSVTSKQPHKIVQIHMRHPVSTYIQISMKNSRIFFKYMKLRIRVWKNKPLTKLLIWKTNGGF